MNTYIAYTLDYGTYCYMLHILSNKEQRIKENLVNTLCEINDEIFHYIFYKLHELYTLSPLGKLCDVYTDNTGYYLLVPIEVKI